MVARLGKTLSAMSTDTQLSTQALSIGALMQSGINAGITPDSVSVLERMMAMHERLQAKQAEQAFAEAFADLQKDMPVVQATQPVQDSKGKTMYVFAPYKKIMDQVTPLTSQHGFALSFDSKLEEGRTISPCPCIHPSAHPKP